VLIAPSIFIYYLSESLCVADSTVAQTDSCEKLSGSYESIKDSTALRRGSDVDCRPIHVNGGTKRTNKVVHVIWDLAGVLDAS
jgi:hypothetical protein